MVLFIIWSHGQKELHRFHQHLTSLHPNIHFTMEEKKKCTLPFLDVLITRRSDNLLTSVYRKPTRTERYIPFSSHHVPPLDHHWSVEVHEDRAHNICDPEFREQESHRPGDVFQANGFPARLVKKTLSAPPEVPCLPPSPTQPPQKILCIPYVCGVSEKVKRICTPLSIRTVFTPACTLKRTLMKVKNQVTEEKAIVYWVPWL